MLYDKVSGFLLALHDRMNPGDGPKYCPFRSFACEDLPVRSFWLLLVLDEGYPESIGLGEQLSKTDKGFHKMGLGLSGELKMAPNKWLSQWTRLANPDNNTTAP